MNLPYSRQNIDDEDIAAVIAALKLPFLTQGPLVENFEAQVAAYAGAKYGVAFNSGTSALHGALYAAGIKAGDEVITTPITFVASANCALYLGAKPVFVDIDPDTLCIDINKIEAAVTPRTKAIVAVDFAGYPLDIKGIKAIGDRHQLCIIEDAAHALGAKRGDLPVGAEADMTMFSFHPVKHITTGEGGIIITDDENMYKRMRMLRSHGIVRGSDCGDQNQGAWYHEMIDLGYNYRITDVQCALGISQLRKLESFIAARNEQAAYYEQLLEGVDKVTIPPPVVNGRHAYHLFPIRLAEGIDRRRVFECLHSKGIGTQVHYIPVHTQPYYQNTFGNKWGDFPISEDYYKRTLSLPLYPGLNPEDQEYIVDSLKEVL